MASEGRISVPDEDEPRTGGLDLVLDAAQLRRLLFAEHSTVVTEPDQHHRSALVERAQGNVPAFEIEHRAVAEPSTGRTTGRRHQLRH